MGEGYPIGMAVGLALGLAIGLPTPAEQRAITAFNSEAVYQTEDEQLCLRDVNQPDAPVVACVDMPAPR